MDGRIAEKPASVGLRAGAAWSCAGSQGALHTRVRADWPLPEVGWWRGAEPSALPLVLLYAPFLRDEVNFYEMHVFKYSIRKGTVAARMPVQIPEPVKGVRSDILLAMTARQSEAFRALFIGKEEELLLEEKAEMPFGTCWRGHTKRYVEGYVLCEEEEQFEAGQLVKGVFTEAAGGAPGLMFSANERAQEQM